MRRFMTTWLLFLPFGLWPILGWAVPGVSCVVAYLLVGTENIGVQLEEPFAIIFMGQIADSCRDSIAEIVETAKGETLMAQAQMSHMRASQRSLCYAHPILLHKSLRTW